MAPPSPPGSTVPRSTCSPTIPSPRARSASASADSTEDSLYDNLAVHGLDGASLFSDDFSASPDPSFPEAPVTGGQIEPGNGITLLDPNPGAPMLRDSFTVGKKVARARAYVDGLRPLRAAHQRARGGGTVLSPPDTPYQQRDLYETYDVTSDLRVGANAVGIWLGNGYGPNFSPYGFRWLGPKQAAMLLEVTYTDGSSQMITTNDGSNLVERPDHRERHLQRRGLRRPARAARLGPARLCRRGLEASHHRRPAERQPRRGRHPAGAGGADAAAGADDRAAAGRLRLRPRPEHRRLGAAARPGPGGHDRADAHGQGDSPRTACPTPRPTATRRPPIATPWPVPGKRRPTSRASPITGSATSR